MKQIYKNAPPNSFLSWQNLRSDNWSPEYPLLRNPEKRVLLQSLLSEQGWVCCYCGMRISETNSHIEHFRPQERYGALQLEYENLFASCVRETVPPDPLHCGHGKGSSFDESLYISPLSDACEMRFRYTDVGEITGADSKDLAARYMIEILNIDLPLRIYRREVIASLDSEFLLSATPEELRRICDANRTPDEFGRLPDLGHVLARYIEGLT